MNIKMKKNYQILKNWTKNYSKKAATQQASV